jgi:hypothetical protein
LQECLQYDGSCCVKSTEERISRESFIGKSPLTPLFHNGVLYLPLAKGG